MAKRRGLRRIPSVAAVLGVALTTALALVLTGCGDNGGGGGNAFIGPTLELSGSVDRISWDNDDRPVFTPFDGDWEVNSSGGTGAITEGQLSFTMGSPSLLMPMEEWWLVEDTEATVSPSDVQMNHLWLNIRNSGDIWPSGQLWRGNQTVASNDMSGTHVDVMYVYVNQDVNIRADRRSWTDDNDGFPWTETHNAFNINLSQGWNAIHRGGNWTAGATSGNETVNVGAGIPGGTRWILQEWGGGLSAEIEPLDEGRARTGRPRAFGLRAR